MAKQLKQYVSFKKDEQYLYDFIESKRDKSCFIKDLIENAYKESNEFEVRREVQKEKFEVEW